MQERLLLVRTTMPDAKQADQLARRLVDERLAACVHTTAISSTYRWHDAVKQEAETLVEARAIETKVEALRKRILALHPYEVPLVEVVALTGVPPTYLDWACEVSQPRPR